MTPPPSLSKISPSRRGFVNGSPRFASLFSLFLPHKTEYRPSMMRTAPIILQEKVGENIRNHDFYIKSCINLIYIVGP